MQNRFFYEGKKKVALLLVLLLAFTVLGCAQQATKPEEGKPEGVKSVEGSIKIGVPTAYTGPAAFHGLGVFSGAQLAADEINAAGGVLGRQIELIKADTEGSPEKGVSAVERLITVEDIDVIVGETSSHVSLATMDITARNRIPFLQVIPTADTISEKIQSNPELYRHVFMFNIPASKIHYTLFDLIENVTKDAGFKDEEKTIAVFVDETDFGRTTGLTWEKWLTDLGWKVYLEIVPFQETEFSPMISKLVELKPTIVKTEFTALTSDTAFVQELYESPINPFQIYGLGQRLKEFGEIVPREMYLYSLNINEGYDLQELSKKFKGADPGFALGGYECIHIMAEAIERAGTLEADAIAESLLETDYQGWYQRTVFDPETHFARQGLEEYKFNCVIQYQEDADPIVWPEKAKQAEFIWPENFLEYRANK